MSDREARAALVAEAKRGAHASCCRDGTPCLLIGRLADALEASEAENAAVRAKVARIERNNRMTVDTPKAYYPSVALTDGYSQAFRNGVAHKQADIDAALRDEPPVGAAK